MDTHADLVFPSGIGLLIFLFILKKDMPNRITNAKSPDERLPLVVCECGFKMLVVPDLAEMVRSIEAHAATREKSESDPEKGEAERCRIEELLTQKVLISIVKKKA